MVEQGVGASAPGGGSRRARASAIGWIWACVRTSTACEDQAPRAPVVAHGAGDGPGLVQVGGVALDAAGSRRAAGRHLLTGEAGGAEDSPAAARIDGVDR